MTLHTFLVGKVQWFVWAERAGSMLVLSGRAARVLLLHFISLAIPMLLVLTMLREAAVSSLGSVMSWVVHGFTDESC